MTKDYLLVPCNPMNTRHWFLLAAFPKQKQIVIMDRLQGSSVNPTQEVAVRKMWKLLKEIDPSLDDETTEWNFVSNHSQLPQQENGYDCGVYVCIYARCLLGLSGAAVNSDSISSFRKQMLLELTTNTRRAVLCSRISESILHWSHPKEHECHSDNKVPALSRGKSVRLAHT